MEDLLEKLAACVEAGKSDRNSAYPPDLKDQDGAVELVSQALESRLTPGIILKRGLIPGMDRLGERFSRGEAFIPDLLMSARAMNAALEVLKPHCLEENLQHRGVVILGTVAGDLHEIGKNLVRMVLEGDGWKVIDLGVDAGTEKFLEARRQHPGAILGLSALLTTTMANMKETVAIVKERFPGTRVYIGGAPVTQEFSDRIGADGYFPDPYNLVKYLSQRD